MTRAHVSAMISYAFAVADKCVVIAADAGAKLRSNSMHQAPANRIIKANLRGGNAFNGATAKY